MRRTQRKQLSDTCPVFTFRLQEPPKNSGIQGAFIEALADGERVGHAILVKAKVPYVSDIRVFPELRRCGLGTKLYEQAAQYACRVFARPLHSDVERSEMSEGFWQKQVAKNRAVCVSKARGAAPRVPGGQPARGRGGCERYRLACPAPRELSRYWRARRREAFAAARFRLLRRPIARLVENPHGE